MKEQVVNNKLTIHVFEDMFNREGKYGLIVFLRSLKVTGIGS